LAELKEAHGMDFRIRTAEVPRPGKRSKRVRISYAAPVRCGVCGGKWEVGMKTEKGLKCEKLEASLRCASCGNAHAMAFCLPEIL
jgi:hypothetical protein